MKISKGIVEIENDGGLEPILGNFSLYTEQNGTIVRIPNKVVLRLYELLKNDAEMNRIDFDAWCFSFFENNSGEKS